VTTFRDGTKEEGKYKNNVLITSQKKKHLFLIRSAKFRERIDAAVDSAQRASKYALQKADIAISRTATARGKAELADVSADHARVDSEVAIQTAREFAPDFKPALLERFERIRVRERFRNTTVNDNDAAKAKLLSDNQVTSNQTNSIVSPNKQINLNQQHNSQQQQQQQQIQAQSSSNLLNPTAPARRTSVNPSAMRQPSVDYTMQNNTSIYANKTNPVDYNTLGHNQQFGQPQPPGNSMGGSGSAFSTPQKLAQNNANSVQQQYNQATSNISVQQSQHNQIYQSSASSHYQQSMNQSQENSFNNYQNQQQQQQQQHNYNDHQGASGYIDPHTGLRRGSRQVSDSGRPMLGAIHQTSIDHFDHYKRPPSRDSSVDRYTRAASRLGASRQPSVDRQVMGSSPSANLTPEISIDRNVRAGSQLRGTTPAPTNINGSVLTGAMGGGTGSTSASRRGSRSGTPVFQQQTSIQQIQAHYSTPNQPFEDVLLRQRTLGQDIIPSPGQPKRTESLFVPQKPVASGGSGGGMGMGMGGGGGGVSKAANKVSMCQKFIATDLSEYLKFSLPFSPSSSSSA
jgi:junctophilin